MIPILKMEETHCEVKLPGQHGIRIDIIIKNEL